GHCRGDARNPPGSGRFRHPPRRRHAAPARHDAQRDVGPRRYSGRRAHAGLRSARAGHGALRTRVCGRQLPVCRDGRPDPEPPSRPDRQQRRAAGRPDAARHPHHRPAVTTMARIVGCRPGATRPGDDDRPVARRPWYVACFWSRVTTAPPALRLRLLVGAAASLLLFGAVRPAVAAQTADEVLGQRVAGAIRSYARYTIFDEVTVHVEDQHVTLTGRVTVPVKKQEIGERVARIEGIRSLTNDI